MQKFILLASAPVLAIATDAQAHAQSIGGSVTAVSDYIFRGVTQTDEGPAIHVDINASWDSGFYAGAWASNVDFGSGDDSNIEVDLYAGWAGSAGGLDLDVMAVAYTYPGGAADDQEFVEFTAAVSRTISDITLDVRAYYSPEFYGEIGPGTYVTAGASLAVTDKVSADIRAGHQTFHDLDDADYADYQAGLTYTHNDIAFGVRYHWGDEDVVEDAWVISVAKSF